MSLTCVYPPPLPPPVQHFEMCSSRWKQSRERETGQIFKEKGSLGAAFTSQSAGSLDLNTHLAPTHTRGGGDQKGHQVPPVLKSGSRPLLSPAARTHRDALHSWHSPPRQLFSCCECSQLGSGGVEAGKRTGSMRSVLLLFSVAEWGLEVTVTSCRPCLIVATVYGDRPSISASRLSSFVLHGRRFLGH